MSSPDYNSSSLGWQVRQGWQRLSEWMEYRADQTDIDWPDWNWPDWWPDWDWLNGEWSPLIGQVLFWGAVSAITIWLSWLLFRALEPSIARWLEQEQSWINLGQKQNAKEDNARTAKDWWQQAQALAKQGHYGEACKALYQATLQQLHDSQRLLHNPSRTDGEYLEKLEEGQSLPRPYQLLIGTHERLVFGSSIASAEMFQRCRKAYEEIQKK